jgi:hypothetical protein
MGRKPNVLITQHFIRGEKVDSVSNRYQHTCSHCGEHFPKGRSEQMMAHLTKKCAALSLREKMDIVMHIHELPSSHVNLSWNDRSAVNRSENNREATTVGNYVSTSTTGRNALDVLAEAANVDGTTVYDRNLFTHTGRVQEPQHAGHDHHAGLLPPDSHLAIDDFDDHFFPSHDSHIVRTTSTTGQY